MTEKATFRELSDQLEDVLTQMQAEDIDVDEALKLHAKGTELLKMLEERLKSAENSVKTLKSKRT